MTEQEQQIKIVDDWINSFKVESKLGDEGLTVSHVDIREVDTMLLRSVLEGCGAEFNPEKEGYGKLRQPTNKFRRPGMDAVWGGEFMDRYNSWTVSWANAYEEAGRKLPKLDQSGNRTSGMRHLLGLITAYAAEQIPFDQFKVQMEGRLVNGFTYAKGLGRSPTDFLPDDKKFPGSIPPLYVEETWSHIKNNNFSSEVPKPAIPPISHQV